MGGDTEAERLRTPFIISRILNNALQNQPEWLFPLAPTGRLKNILAMFCVQALIPMSLQAASATDKQIRS